MSDKDLHDALRKLKDRGVETFPVTVVSVNKIHGTCEVSDGTLTYQKVRLSAVNDGSGKKFYLFPKVGSSVLVSPIIEDIKQLYVEQYSEIEECELLIGTTRFNVDALGITLERGNNNLKDIISGLIDEVMSVVVLPGYGTTPNVAALTQLKLKLNQVLK